MAGNGLGNFILMHMDSRHSWKRPATVTCRPILRSPYALAGDKEKALQNLEAAYAQRDDEMTMVIRMPAMDSLKSDPRWAALLQKLGLPL